MSSVTRYPSANNGGWDANEANGYADDGAYATTAPGTNSTESVEYGNFGFDAQIPAGATINSVTLNAQWKVSTTASSATFRLAGLISNVVEGTEHTDTSEPTSDKTTNFAMTSLPTRDELLDGVFEVRVGAQRGAGATGYTMSLDYVSVTVDYTVPNTAPTVALNTPADTAETSDTTPALTFTGTDAESDDIRYNIQVIQRTTIDSYSESNANGGGALTNLITKYGQSFTGNGDYLKQVVLYLRKSSSPTGNAYVKIYAHSGTFGTSSVPTGTALATSDAFDVSTLTTEYQLITFNFSSPYQLTDETYYVLTIEYTGEVLNQVYVGTDGFSPAHAGNWCSYTGSWTSNNLLDGIFYALGYSTALLDKVSGTDPGFSGTPDNTDPFASVQAVTYTPIEVVDSYSVDNYSGTSNYLSSYTSDFEGVGQSFTGNGKSLEKIALYLRKTGSPTGNATINIYNSTTDGSGYYIPTGSVLASETLDVSTLTTSYELIEVTFSSKITLTDETVYILTIEYSGGDASNNVAIGVDLTSPTHSGNKCKTSDGVTWTGEITTDAIFYVYSSILSIGTYYWRVRGIDPSGSNTYSDWSTMRSFDIISSGTDTNDTCAAKITGKTTTNSTRSAKVTGKTTTSVSRAAKTTGSVNETSTRAGKLLGIDTIFVARNAKVIGKSISSDTRDSKLIGSANITSARDAKLTGKDTDSDIRSAKITGKTAIATTRAARMTGESGAVDIDDTRGAKLTGSVATNAERAAILTGKTTTNNTRNAKITGKSTSTSEKSATLTGIPIAVQSERNSKVLGIDTNADERSAILVGYDITSNNRTAKISGTDITANNRNAKIIGKNTSLNARNAKIVGIAGENDTRSAKIVGKSADLSSRDARITGSAISNAERDGHLYSKDITNDIRNAHIIGKTTDNNTRSAHIVGKSTTSTTRAGHIIGGIVEISARTGHISGIDTTTSDRGAKTTGFIGAVANRSAKVTGKNTSADERTAHIIGGIIETSARSAKVIGKETTSDEHTSKVIGKVATNNIRSAKVTGKTTISNARSAKLTGKEITADSRSAHINGVDITSSVRDAHIIGKEFDISSRNAHIYVDAITQDNRAAKIVGINTDNSTRSSKVTGQATSNNTRDAKIIGALATSNERSGHIYSGNVANDNRSSHIIGIDTDTSERNSKITGNNASNDIRNSKITGKIATSSNRSTVITGYAETLYQKEVKVSLPADATNLMTNYTSQEVIDVSTSDDIRVDLEAESAGYLIHQYKKYSENNIDPISVTWEGQTTIAPSMSTIYLQIYNQNTTTWETFDTESVTTANTDFILNGSITASVSDYYDGNNSVAIRIYQQT